MTQPIFPPVDPITGALPAPTEARYAAAGATTAALNAKAALASPALSGTPTAPTATAGTNTTQVATTAFVNSAAAAAVTGKADTSTVNTALAAKVGALNGVAMSMLLITTPAAPTLSDPLIAGAPDNTLIVHAPAP